MIPKSHPRYESLLLRDKIVKAAEKGYLADILIVDTQGYSFVSPGSFDANFVYASHADCIESVICNGKFVMRNRVVPNEAQILKEAKETLKKLL